MSRSENQRLQPGEMVIWERPGRPPVRGIVLRDQGRVALEVRIGGKIYHPLRRHVRTACEHQCPTCEGWGELTFKTCQHYRGNCPCEEVEEPCHDWGGQGQGPADCETCEHEGELGEVVR